MKSGTSLVAVLDGLLERARLGDEGPGLMAAIEDALATASLEALKADMRGRRVSGRIDELTGGSPDEGAVDALRHLVAHRAQLERDATALRARVADLRERFMALGGTRIAG